MKIKKITTQNFIGARDIDVVLDRPVAIFAGCNGAGKSSLQEAVRMALVGESARIGLKKDYAQLVSQGADSGFAEVETDKGNCSIVLPSGKGTHGGGDALRFVLDAQRFARLEPNERRAFLFGLTGIGINAKDIAERMAARGCDDGKASSIAAFLRAGFDAAQKEAQTKARECKAAWKSTANGETYGSQKAASWAAAKPEADAGKLDQARADLAAIEAELETETTRHGELQGRARQATEQRAKLADLREKAGKFARIQDKLNKDEAGLMEWEQKVSVLNGAIKSQDALACPDCGVMLVIKDGELIHAAPMAKGTDDDLARLPEYENALKLMQSAVANGKRDLAAAEAAAGALRELEESGMTEAPSDEEITALKARIDAIKHSRANQQAGIRMLEDAVRQANEADEKTRRAAAFHQDVQQWEAIGDALAPDGIPGDMLAEALGPINDRLAMSSNTSEWLRIGIDKEMAITAEGGRSYALLSESEKWRADAMIAEAVAHLSGIRLLVLDRFDVLDIKGREDLLYWLDAMAEDGELDTALVFGTLKALPAQLPETVAAFWIENGATGHMKQAA